VERQNANAAMLAAALEKHPHVSCIRASAGHALLPCGMTCTSLRCGVQPHMPAVTLVDRE
jgi:hypothetical protein